MWKLHEIQISVSTHTFLEKYSMPIIYVFPMAAFAG